MTTTATTTRPIPSPSPTPRTRRWLGAGAVVVALGVAAVLALDTSSTQPAVTPAQVDGAATAAVGGDDLLPISADAAEREAIAAAEALVERCSAGSPNAAERCIAAG